MKHSSSFVGTLAMLYAVLTGHVHSFHVDVKRTVPRHALSTQLTALSSDNVTGCELSRRDLLARVAFTTAASLVVGGTTSSPAWARLEAVNRPDLLPKESGLNVIQTEKFLTTGQAKRMNELLAALERDTGFRLRVLCQR